MKHAALSLALEGDRKKAVEARLSAQIDQCGEVVAAVRHLALSRRPRARQPATGGGEDDEEPIKAPRVTKPVGSSSLAAGLGLPVVKMAATAGSGVGGSSAAATAAAEEIAVSQTARDLAALESALPTLRALKQERSHLVGAATSGVTSPSPRAFPLHGMIGEVELARLKQSELSSAHATMLAFLEHYPTILAQLKFKLCTRWARFSVGLSTGLYENVAHIEKLGARLYESLTQIHRAYSAARSRRADFLTPSQAHGIASASSSSSTSSGVGSSGSGPSSGGVGGGIFREDLLHSADMERYFRWIIPNLTAAKDFNRFLLQCKWMAFLCSPGSNSGAFGGMANEILDHFQTMRRNPHLADRDEELKGMSAPSAGPSLHALLAETRAKLRTKRRYAFVLPCLLLDESSIHSAIARVGTLSLVTPLDYENGHPLLNQILKIFPALFDEVAKRRASRMRPSDQLDNIEMDRAAGCTHVKRATWIPFMHWYDCGDDGSVSRPRDRRNLATAERLGALSSLDAQLLTENAFVDSGHLEFVLHRLKHLSVAAHTRTLAHLRGDTRTKAGMEGGLAQMRKTPHHIVSLNYTAIAAGPHAPANTTAAEADSHSTEQTTQSTSSTQAVESDAAIHASVVPPVPTASALSSRVLIPPLPAVAFTTVIPTTQTTPAATAAAAAAAPIISTTPAPTGNSSASASTATINTAAPTPGHLPPHKLHILFTLRFLRLRVLKDRVASVLNFNRSVQRKLTLDAHGYAFEDRFQFHSEHVIRAVPHTAPAPLRAWERATNASSAASTGAGATVGGSGGAAASGAGGSRKGADSSTLHTVEGGHGLTTQLPRLHTHLASYLPTEYESSESSFMSFAGIERRDDSYKWRAGREKHVDEWEGEVQVDDACGIPIVYDAALDDFDRLEEQLMSLGTYYIDEHRARVDVSGGAAGTHDVVDRWSLLVDLWEAEAEFQIFKSRLLDIYLEVYEHTLARPKQRQIAQRMIELIDLRPYVDLAQPVAPGASRYFTHSYALHCKLLSQQILFLRAVLDWQMSHEKQQSKRWEAQDWRVFLQTARQTRDAAARDHSGSNSNNASKGSTNTSRATTPSEQTRAKSREARRAARARRGGDSVEVEDDDDSSDEHEDKPSSARDTARDSRRSVSSTTPGSATPATSDSDATSDGMLEQLAALQIANSPSPFCRSFRVGMLDVLPSVSLVVDLLDVMDDTAQRLMERCATIDDDDDANPICGSSGRPVSNYDYLALQLSVLQHTSAAWARHCQTKNSTLYDGSPHREILLGLEMSAVLHDPRAACAAIHSYVNGGIDAEAANVLQMAAADGDARAAAAAASASAAASLQAAISAESADARAKADAALKNTLAVSAAAQRRLKRLSNLVEIEDEDELDEDESEEESDAQARSLKHLAKSLPSGAASTALTTAAANADDERIDSGATRDSPSSHMVLVVSAAQEKIKLLICINLLEAVSLTSILLQQVFESHVLTQIYRCQAASIGLSCVRSLIDPYAIAYGESSVEDGDATALVPGGRQCSSFLLAIMETEETLPIALRDFVKVEQHLRLDPYLFHGYDQTLLGTSPATTPGHGSAGRASPGFGGGDINESGSGSWSARTSLIAYQPSGRARRFFHRPNHLNANRHAPPSTAIIRALRASGRSGAGATGGAANGTPTSRRPTLSRAASVSSGFASAEEDTSPAGTRARELAALMSPSRGRLGHRRSVSDGSVSTVLSPSLSSAAALAALPALKPLELKSGRLTIELMEDPLTAAKRSTSRERDAVRIAAKAARDDVEPATDSGTSLAHSDALPPAELEVLKRGAMRPRSHSLWQMPSSFVPGALGGLPPHATSTATTPAADHDRTTIRIDVAPSDDLDADGPPSAEAHLARAQRRSLIEAQKSRARDKVRRARTQRVQAERELAEEEKARRDALKAEEPKELCELWLLAFRRIVQAQVAHKHALAVAVHFHDMASTHEDTAIEHLPHSASYRHSSVAEAHAKAARERDGAVSEAAYYGVAPSAASLRTASPPSLGSSHSYLRVSGISRSLGTSGAASLGSSSLVTPYNRSSTASPAPRHVSSSASGSSGDFAPQVEPRVGCLTSRTFLYLDGLKRPIFDAFQSRQHFNHAQVGLTLAVAGLASAEEHENSSATKRASVAGSSSTPSSHHPKHTRSASLGVGSMSTLAGGGQQMLWLRTKKEQDKLDGMSLHAYNLDVLHALVYHIYVIEAAHVAERLAFVHHVTLGGASTGPEETISPFSMARSRARRVDDVTPVAPPARPTSKYARIRALPISSVGGASKRSADATSPPGSDDEGDTDAKPFVPVPGHAATEAALTMLPADELTVQDLLSHVNSTQAESVIDAPAKAISPAVVAGSSGSSSGAARSRSKSSLKAAASRSSLHSSTAGSPTGSTRNLHEVAANAPAAGSAASGAATTTTAVAAASAAPTDSSSGAAASSVSVAVEEDLYSSDSESDSELGGAELLDEADEQYLLRESASLGRVRADGRRIAASHATSTSFLFRIARPAGLLALLVEERQSAVSIDRLKLDLLSRQMMLDIFHLCLAAVALDDLAGIAQPVAPDANAAVNAPNGHTVAACAPQQHASRACALAFASCSSFATPPADHASMLPMSLTCDQQRRLSVMIQRHVVVNARDVADEIGSAGGPGPAATSPRAASGATDMQTGAHHAADTQVTPASNGADASSEGNAASLLNSEGSIRLVLDTARRMSGRPDAFWTALVQLLRTKRATLQAQMQLFVRVHHERLIASGAASETDEPTAFLAATPPALPSEHLLRPGWTRDTGALDPSRHARTAHVLLREYDDASDRIGFARPDTEPLARAARLCLLQAAGAATASAQLRATSRVIAHPFALHRFNRDLPASHGGPAALFDRSWVLQTQPRNQRDEDTTVAEAETDSHSVGATAGNGVSAMSVENAVDGALSSRGTPLTAWERDALAHHLLAPDTLSSLVPALVANSGSRHLGRGAYCFGAGSMLRQALEQTPWSFLPSSRRTRDILAQHWRDFSEHVHAVIVVRALDAPRTVQGERTAMRRLKAAAASPATAATDGQDDAKRTTFKVGVGISQRQKPSTNANTNSTDESVGTPSTGSGDSHAPATAAAPVVTPPEASDDRSSGMPVFSIEKDLDALESTSLKLTSLLQLLDTTATLTRLFDVYAALKLQVVPTTPVGGADAQAGAVVGYGRAGPEEAHAWSQSLQTSVVLRFGRDEVAQTLQWFERDILFRMRQTHAARRGAMVGGSTPGDVPSAMRRSRVEALWRLVATRIRQPGFLRQMKAGAAAKDKILPGDDSALLTNDTANLEAAYSHFRSRPSLQPRPFHAYRTFAEYALSLTHAEAEEAIRYLRSEIEVMLLKQCTLALAQRAAHTLQVYARTDLSKASGAGSLAVGLTMGGAGDFITKVPPVHQLLLRLLPTRLTLGQLLDDPAIQQANAKGGGGAITADKLDTVSSPLYPHSSNPSGYFVVGESELHKSLQTFARSVLFYGERAYLARLAPQLEMNHVVGLRLFARERALHCLRAQVRFQTRQCLLAADCNVLDLHYPLIAVDHANHVQSVRESRQVLRMRASAMRRGIRAEFDTATLGLLGTLRAIRRQFKRTRTFLERTVGQNIKRVKDEVMVALLDGQFTQATLFQLFKQHRDSREAKMVAREALRPPPHSHAMQTMTATTTQQVADLVRMENQGVRMSLAHDGLIGSIGSTNTASTPQLRLDSDMSNDFALARASVDALKAALVARHTSFVSSFETRAADQRAKVQQATATLATHSWLAAQLATLQSREKADIQTLTELRFLLSHAEMDAEQYKKLTQRLAIDKKRLSAWRTDHIFRFQELKYRTTKYARLKNVTDLREVRERIEFTDLELARLGREEAAHTVAQVASESRFEAALAEAEAELVEKRIAKMRAFDEMKQAIARQNRVGASAGAGGEQASATDSKEVERLNYHKKMWDRCLFQTHVMQQEQLCLDLEAENETLRQVMEHKMKGADFASMQGSLQPASNGAVFAHPPLDGPRALPSAPVTVPAQVPASLFPPQNKSDSWNGPATGPRKPVLGVSIDARAGEVHHSVHGFGPISPVPPVPASLYYFDPHGRGGHPEALTSPFTKSLGSVFSSEHHRAALAHPAPERVTAHLHRVAHEYPPLHSARGTASSAALGITIPPPSSAAAATAAGSPTAVPRTIDQALGIGNTPRALMHAAGVEPKPSLSESQEGGRNPVTSLPPRNPRSAARIAGARTHAKMMRDSTASGADTHTGSGPGRRPPSLGLSVARHLGLHQDEPDEKDQDEVEDGPPATQDDPVEEAAARRADDEVNACVTFPLLDGLRTKAKMEAAAAARPNSSHDPSRASSAGRMTPRPPSGIGSVPSGRSRVTSSNGMRGSVAGDPSGPSAAGSARVDAILSAAASATHTPIDFGALGQMDMMQWRAEVLRLTRPAAGSGATSTTDLHDSVAAMEAATAPHHSASNDWQGYSIMSTGVGGGRGASVRASLAARTALRPGSLSARGMDDALLSGLATRDLREERAAQSVASSYPSGSATARVRKTRVAPAASEEKHASVSRPPLRQSVAHRPTPSTHVHVQGPAAHAFASHVSRAPALTLTGVAPPTQSTR